MRATSEARDQIDELADKCNQGEPTDAERAEYLAHIDALCILQANARSVLARQPNGRKSLP